MERITERKVVLKLSYDELMDMIRNTYDLEHIAMHNVHVNSEKEMVTIILIQSNNDHVFPKRVEVSEAVPVKPRACFSTSGNWTTLCGKDAANQGFGWVSDAEAVGCEDCKRLLEAAKGTEGSVDADIPF